MTKASSATTAPPASSNDGTDRFRVGTLRYTKMGLAMLFVWLLWGDFCFQLMETVVPSILPLKLQGLNASNILVGVVMSTIPSAMNLMVNPIVSFRSDRYRSRFGRRIPFLLWATPPLTACLVLLGYCEPIGHWLHRAVVVPLIDISPASVVIGLIVVFMVLFQLFNMFVSSVYYYLFNDVVPVAFLGRFMALFRMLSAGAGAIFYFFIYPHAQTHMKEIFLFAGLGYFVSFMLMCWKVKEGEYPPPPQNLDGKKGIKAAVRTYLVECFTHRFYWDFFLTNMFFSVSMCFGAFVIYLQLSIGLTLTQLGQISGWSGIVSTLLLYPAGILADRIHPLRMMLLAMAILVLVAPLNLIWLFVEPTSSLVLKFSIFTAVVSLPLGVLYTAALLPMYMRLLPKERYGQFGSADAVVRSLGVIAGGPLAGLCMDGMKRIYHDDPFYYRYAPVGVVVMLFLSLVFLYRVYRYWKRHGGDDGYSPPQLTAAINEQLSPPKNM